MSQQHTESMMEKTIEKIKSLVQSDTIIGAPITVGQVTLIPVSKVTYGFAAGGTDHASKHNASSPITIRFIMVSSCVLSILLYT